MLHHKDLHKAGVFAIRRPEGSYIFETFAQTAHGAIAQLRVLNQGRWSVLEEEGYTIAEFTQSGVVRKYPFKGMSFTTQTFGLEATPLNERAVGLFEAACIRKLGAAPPGELLIFEDIELSKAAVVIQIISLTIEKEGDAFDEQEFAAILDETLKASDINTPTNNSD